MYVVYRNRELENVFPPGCGGPARAGIGPAGLKGPTIHTQSGIVYLSYHCVGELSLLFNEPFLFYSLVTVFSSLYLHQKKQYIFDLQGIVRKGYELLLLAIWIMLLAPQMTKPKLAYLFFFFFPD